MSDITNSSSINYSSNRRLSQIDDTIEYLTQEVNSLNDVVYKKEFQCSLMTVKMKREKLKALSAFARSQVLLTDMEIMIAEGDLFTDVEKLRNFKKLKLEREEGQSQTDVQETIDKSSQTSKSMIDKKKHRHSSSRKSPVDLDISTEETLIIPTIHQSTALCEETSQIAKTIYSLDLFSKSPRDKSDSEISLSSSIKAAFNEPYTKTEELIKKSPAKKLKTDKKVEYKSKKHTSKRNVSPTESSQTLADHGKSINMTQTLQNSHSINPKNSNISAYSLVPITHNMPAVIPQPSTSTRTPHIYVNPATQTSMHYHSQKAGSSHSFSFYGSKQ